MKKRDQSSANAAQTSDNEFLKRYERASQFINSSEIEKARLIFYRAHEIASEPEDEEISNLRRIFFPNIKKYYPKKS